MNSFEVNRHLNNKVELHPDNYNWANFLKTQTDFLFEDNGYKLYNTSNQWYIVCPDGFIRVDYGYHIWSHFSSLTGMDSGEVRKKIENILDNRSAQNGNKV
jgi:hypothetical protein